jgi:hypothetical protein
MRIKEVGEGMTFQEFYHGLIMGHGTLSDHDKKYLISRLDKEWEV